MKTVKLTILFKSGVEKSYIIPNSCEDDINKLSSSLYANMGIGETGTIRLHEGSIIIALDQIASVEIEVLE